MDSQKGEGRQFVAGITPDLPEERNQGAHRKWTTGIGVLKPPTAINRVDIRPWGSENKKFCFGEIQSALTT